jgi:nitroreductase
MLRNSSGFGASASASRRRFKRRTLIVAVARPDFWRMGRRLAMKALARDATVPGIAESYDALIFKYRVLIPLMFEDGPCHALAPLKRLILWIFGLFRVFWRFDTGRSGQSLWATKTTALACQNLMLALRAAGYDSCAMEGFDEPRVKRLLGLPGAAHIVMIIAAGKRAEGSVMPLYRFDRNLYVQRI